MDGNIDNNSQKEMKKKLINKVTPFIRKNGFQSLRMEEIAKYMDVSKATMYKYFASKEEVMESAVAVFIEDINEIEVESCDTTQSFVTGVQQIFEQSVLLAAYISHDCLNDLHVIYPALYNRLGDAMRRREKQMLDFYQEGKNKSIFNEFNENLIFLQDRVLVRAMLDTKFLMTHNMTLNQVLWDYYYLIEHQLFKAEQLQIMDDSNMKIKIDTIANKIISELY